MKRKVFITIIAMIIMLSMTFSTFAATLQEKKKKIEKQILESEEKLEEIEANLSDTMKEIKKLNSSIANYEEELSDLNKKVNNLENEIEETEEKIKESEKKEKVRKEVLEKRAIAMLKMGKTTYLDVLLNSADITELISNYFLIGKMADLDGDFLVQMQKEIKASKDLKKELEEKEQEVVKAKSEVEKKAVALKNEKTQKNSYIAKLNAEEAVLQEKIDEYNKEASKVDAAIAAQAAKNESNNNYVKYTGGTLAWPTRNGKYVTSVYAPGGRTDIPVSGTTHRGIDLNAPQGTPVYAAADGVVSYVNASGWGGGYGTYVVLSHGNGLYTLYAHGSGIGNISVGSTVTTDTVIMYSGNTGWSYGAHLHFEVCLGSVSNKVNPAPYLGIENRTGYVQ